MLIILISSCYACSDSLVILVSVVYVRLYKLTGPTCIHVLCFPPLPHIQRVILNTFV